jgi:hypothetical protein
MISNHDSGVTFFAPNRTVLFQTPSLSFTCFLSRCNEKFSTFIHCTARKAWRFCTRRTYPSAQYCNPISGISSSIRIAIRIRFVIISTCFHKNQTIAASVDMVGRREIGYFSRWLRTCATLANQDTRVDRFNSFVAVPPFPFVALPFPNYSILALKQVANVVACCWPVIISNARGFLVSRHL